MTRSRALLGRAAVAVMVALGFPSLTAMASAGTESPTTGTSGTTATLTIGSADRSLGAPRTPPSRADAPHPRPSISD